MHQLSESSWDTPVDCYRCMVLCKHEWSASSTLSGVPSCLPGAHSQRNTSTPARLLSIVVSISPMHMLRSFAVLHSTDLCCRIRTGLWYGPNPRATCAYLLYAPTLPAHMSVTAIHKEGLVVAPQFAPASVSVLYTPGTEYTLRITSADLRLKTLRRMTT
jgi:hypothetical protein